MTNEADRDTYRAAVDAADARFHALSRALGAKEFKLAILRDAGRTLYAAERWGQSRDFDSLDAVRAFAEQVGAASDD